MTTQTGPYARVALDGQRILIVGAANGIGRAAAGLLADRGASVLCTDRDGSAAATLAEELTARGCTAASAWLDVADSDTVHQVVATLIAEHGPLHAVLNSAGITGKTGIMSSDVEIEDFDRVLSVNLRGAFVLSQAVLAHLVDRGYGRLLHIASIAGKEGNAGMVSYSASKAGLIGMVKSMGKEYAESGVTVNALAPAVIRTAMVDALPESQVNYMTSRIPMQRCAELNEAAELIAWALSPAASFITGFTFDLSGGRAVY